MDSQSSKVFSDDNEDSDQLARMLSESLLGAHASRKHAYIMLTRLNFYTVKLGFTEVYVIFLISARKYRLWVNVITALPRRF